MAESRRTSSRRSTSKGSQTPGPRAGSGQILLVDDEVLVLSATARILRAHHYGSVFAASLADAHTALMAQPFAGAILDVGLLGNEVLKNILELRGLQPGLPILLSTGGLAPEVAERLETCAFLAKPFTPRLLMSRLEGVMRQAGRPVSEAGGAP